MKIKISAYKNSIIVEAIDAPLKDKAPNWYPIGPGKIGCVLVDTKKFLEVSEEALTLMEKVKRCSDDIGDIDWFKSDKGDAVFCWLGNFKAIFDCREIVGSRTYSVFRDQCIIVPNNPPAGAIEAIDKE